jgi:hypothetical protein
VIHLYGEIPLNACASIRLTKVWVDGTNKGQPVSDILVIGITEPETFVSHPYGRFALLTPRLSPYYLSESLAQYSGILSLRGKPKTRNVLAPPFTSCQDATL